MTTGTMPGISSAAPKAEEDPQGEELKVYKTSEDFQENENKQSVTTLFEDAADLAFSAEVERTSSTEPGTSGAGATPAATAPQARPHQVPPQVVKPQARTGSGNNSGAAGISPNQSKNAGPSLGRTHLIGSKTAFVPANKLQPQAQPSINGTTTANNNNTPAGTTSGSEQGQNAATVANLIGSPSTNNNNSENLLLNGNASTGGGNFVPSFADTMAAAAAAANFPVPNGFIPTSSPAFLFWPASGYSVLGQPFPLPAAASPLFFPGLPRPGVPVAPVQNGAGPAGALGALALDPTKIANTGSPSYTSPCYFPTAGCSPSFDLPPFAPPGLTPTLARFSPAAVPLLSAASPANFSPLHSPQTGTPIVPGAPKPHNEFLGSAPSLRVQMDLMQMANMAAVRSAAVAANAGTNVTLPPSGLRMIPASPLAGHHPLASMASLKLPSVTTTVTSLATTLAAQPANGHLLANHNQALRRSATNERLLGTKVANGRRPSAAEEAEARKQHIKKPLNAFMLFMKENRARLMEEKGYKERQSAELNKELGRLWHTLSQDDQQKYYQMARDEKQKHHHLYPEWSARDNYAVHKKKKRKRDKMSGDDNLEQKKCRARFGLDQQAKWCKHCRRKKKCLWFREGGGPPGSSGSSSSTQHNPESSEQSPVQVSSTTQGSPPEQQQGAGTSSAGGDGPPPAKVGRGSSSSDVSSPSAVSSTTKVPKGPNSSPRKAAGSDEDDDVSDDDVTSDDDEEDYNFEEFEGETTTDPKPVIKSEHIRIPPPVGDGVTSLTPPTDQSVAPGATVSA